MKKVISFVLVLSLLLISTIPSYAGYVSNGNSDGIFDLLANLPDNPTGAQWMYFAMETLKRGYSWERLGDGAGDLFNNEGYFKWIIASMSNSYYGSQGLKSLLYSDTSGIFTYKQIQYIYLAYIGCIDHPDRTLRVGDYYDQNGQLQTNPVVTQFYTSNKTNKNNAYLAFANKSSWISDVFGSPGNVLCVHYASQGLSFLQSVGENLRAFLNRFIGSNNLAQFALSIFNNAVNGNKIFDVMLFDTNGGALRHVSDNCIQIISPYVNASNLGYGVEATHRLTSGAGNAVAAANDPVVTKPEEKPKDDKPSGTLPSGRDIYIDLDPKLEFLQEGDDRYQLEIHYSGETFNFTPETFVDGSASTIIDNVQAGGDLYYSPTNQAYTYYQWDDHSQTYYTWNITNNYNYTYINYYMPGSDQVGAAYQFYYELPDGRSSAELTIDEVKGMVFGFDVINYDEYSEDPYQQFLYHFDGNIDNDGAFNPYYNIKTQYHFTDGTDVFSPTNNGSEVKSMILPAGSYTIDLSYSYSGSWSGRNGGYATYAVYIGNSYNNYSDRFYYYNNSSQTMTTTEASQANTISTSISFVLEQQQTVNFYVHGKTNLVSLSLTIDAYSIEYRQFDSHSFDSSFEGNPVSFVSDLDKYPVDDIVISTGALSGITSSSLFLSNGNLFDSSFVVGSLNSNGDLVSSSSWWRASNFISVPSVSSLVFSADFSDSRLYYQINVHFFDSSFNHLSSSYLTNYSNISQSSISLSLSLPSNCSYLRLAFARQSSVGINELQNISLSLSDISYFSSVVYPYSLIFSSPFYGGTINLSTGEVKQYYNDSGIALVDPVVSFIDPVTVRTFDGSNVLWSDIPDSVLNVRFRSESFVDYNSFEFTNGAQYSFVQTGDDNYKAALYLDGLSHTFRINMNEGSLSSGSDWTFTYRYYQELSSSEGLNHIYFGGGSGSPCYLVYNGYAFKQLVFNGTTLDINIPIPVGSWNTITVVRNGNTFTLYVNGLNAGTVVGSTTYSGYSDLITWDFANDSLVKYIDELMFADVSLYTSNHTPRLQPYDSGTVLVVPVNVSSDSIAVHSYIPITEYRIGGVRPTFPSFGFCYIHLTDYVIDSIQVWNGYQWTEASGMVFYQGHWYSLENFNFSTVGEAFDGNDHIGVDPFADNQLPMYQGGIESGNSFLNSIYKLLYSLLAGILDIITDLFKLVLDLIRNFFDSIVSFISSILEGVYRIFQYISPLGIIIGNLLYSIPSDVLVFLRVSFLVILLAAFAKLFL